MSCMFFVTFVFQERGSVSIAASKAIPWSLASDLSLMVRITDSGKKLVCLADLCCDAAQSEGVTEISIDDHDLTQAVKENLACFRWFILRHDHCHVVTLKFTFAGRDAAALSLQRGKSQDDHCL